MIKRTTLLSVLLVFVFAASGLAEEWVLDAAHSKVEFTANSRLVKADGQFHKFSAKVDVNERELPASKLTVTIEIASIDTGNERRDTHLRTKDFFDAETFPAATIELRSLRKISPTEYEASTNIVMHGVTKTLTLPVKIEMPEGGLMRIAGATEISRKDFRIGADLSGMVNAANPIQDLVSVRYEISLRKTAASEGAATNRSRQTASIH